MSVICIIVLAAQANPDEGGRIEDATEPCSELQFKCVEFLLAYGRPGKGIETFRAELQEFIVHPSVTKGRGVNAEVIAVPPFEIEFLLDNKSTSFS